MKSQTRFLFIHLPHNEVYRVNILDDADFDKEVLILQTALESKTPSWVEIANEDGVRAASFIFLTATIKKQSYLRMTLVY